VINVVDQDVKPLVFGVDPLHERADLARLEMVDRDGDPGAAGGADELGGLLDRLRPVIFRPPLAGAAAGAIHGGSCFPERDRRVPPGPARRARDERNLAVERFHRARGSARAVHRASCPRRTADYAARTASASA
jgi:hypothetical protein